MEYLSSKEIAKKWKVSERTVRYYCSNKKILGCYLKGKTWMIPETSIKPIKKNKNILLDNGLLKALIEEKKAKLPGRIYHKLQIEFTYNSNHIEGSKLTHDQTRAIFETKTLGHTNTSTLIDDIIETSNHFRCIDYVIDTANRKLTETYIKRLHLLLKQSTSDSSKEWFKVGEYKLLENEVGGQPTSSVNNVSKDIKNLLNKYNSLEKIDIKNIIDFHYHFEKIHPFQDGNGRIGRLIMLKECLKHNIVPILIKDEFKEYYYRGLKEYHNQKGYLIDTCLHGQDIVKSYLDYFKIKY